MRFTNAEQLYLPVVFERVIPGRLHRDGSRYLPLLGLRLADGLQLGVVDRHHRVDLDLVGSTGSAQIIFLLSQVQLQAAGVQRKGLQPESPASQLSLSPTLWGQVQAVPVWEAQHQLSYAAVYLEAHIQIGSGVVGLRTTLTAPDLQASLGTERLHVGDWVQVQHSRIDILAFHSTTQGGPP